MSTLTEDEITKAQSLINKTTPGTYELKSIYGSEWRHVISPTSFGARFKNIALAGKLNGIEHDSLRIDNHIMYRILGIV
ncbi:hypothetical protein C8R34_1625 [Nitrosomonas sp. Nm84]|nr:hypothetical protein C8R34_1625 [Nitrosomonas sp. Nm84]